MIIHIHSTLVPNSGELKRMKNIDYFVTNMLETKSVEVVTYYYKRSNEVKAHGRFNLSENVKKKYYVSAYPYVSKILLNFFYAWLVFRYRPTCIIGEMMIAYKHLWLVRKLFPQIKIVVDIHGALAEEARYQKKLEATVSRYRTIEKNEVEFVDSIICQSDEMKRYLVREYNANPNKICVFRCGVDTNLFHIDEDARTQIRKELGIHDNTVLFCYSGGLHPWQRVDDTLKLFELYHKKNPDSKLLVLTGDRERLNEMIKEFEINNDDRHIIGKTLPFEKVPSYLNACDLAFLLRHNHAMNVVASPTKLAEYMSCGLVVITSEVANKWVGEDGEKYFILEDNANDSSYVEKKLLSVKRSEISDYARRILSLEVDKKSLAISRCFFD